EQLDWFHRTGVTHLLSFRAVDPEAWSARLVGEGSDPFLNLTLARPYRAPFYLYELEGSRARVAFSEEQPTNSARIVEYRANRVVADADSSAGGRLILTDLAWPGWNAVVDGEPARSVVVEGMFRGVDLSSGK